MNKILNIYKPIGKTPYQIIEALRKKMPEYKDIKIGFAGRLDPLAHGVLLLMIGDATKNRDLYLELPKEYKFEILFGVSTDTYDALGFLQDNAVKNIPQDLRKQTQEFIKNKTGIQTQKYPPYSSKEVAGKPLFQWAREDKLSEIKVPTRKIEIYKLNLLGVKETPANLVKKLISKNISIVGGDFRQAETLHKWNKFFESDVPTTLMTARCSIECSSGTYVRSLVNELGLTIGTGAIALEILRTKVGEHTLEESVNL